MADQLLSLAQAAEFLGVAETTVARLIERHGLPVTPVGYARKISAEELERWVEAQQVAPGALGHLA